MPDDLATLAQAASRIATLESLLSDANALATRAQSERDALHFELEDVRARSEDPAPLKARIADLEKLLAPPPVGSGIEKVTYDGGRVKWAVRADGAKFVLPADAMHHSDLLDWMALGFTEAIAEKLLMGGNKAKRSEPQ